MAAPPDSGDVVTLAGAYGLVEDSIAIGGVLNARSRAFTAQAITNNTSGSAPTGWVQGTDRAIAAGTNRVLIASVCWEKNTPSDTLTVTSCTYGGETMTEISTVSINDPALPSEVMVSAWLLKEADIATASTSLLECTLSEGLDISGTRPPIYATGVYENIVQDATTILDTETDTILDGSTALQTAALSPTSDPGVAVLLGCAGNNGSWTPGTGWDEQLDVGEDGAPGQRFGVFDRATSADTPAGEASFTKSQAFTERIAGIAVALNGGDVIVPPTDPVYTQTHVAVYAHDRPEGTIRVGPIDGVVRLGPRRKFVARAQVEVETAASSAFVYEWWCSDNGGAYYEVQDASTGWVSFIASTRSSQLPLANVLDLGGDAFVSCGVRIDADSASPISCASSDVGQRFEYELSGVIDTDAVAGQTITCRLRQAGGVVLDTYTNSVDILVTTPSGFGP
jgi:hypothetical protein